MYSSPDHKTGPISPPSTIGRRGEHGKHGAVEQTNQGGHQDVQDHSNREAVGSETNRAVRVRASAIAAYTTAARRLIGYQMLPAFSTP